MSLIWKTRLWCSSEATVVRVPSEKSDLSAYLEDLGIRPGCRVTLESIEPFGGPVYLEVGGHRHGISPVVAGTILVIPLPDSSHPQ